ncbi:uncharacterized protein LOC124530511 [Vanessa cardui]|uniref:uncharacterized protein LOC124530511 n=1 Tax=Vanessa cardui TaxID=171605 RepID=UPI001F141651|nr:uncharacterized protein LOC124530511 [Vanessa cardui]
MCEKTTPKPKKLTKTTKKLHKNITTTLKTRKPVAKTTTLKKNHYTPHQNKNKLNSTLHSIPVLSDDYSMLSVFELLLTKTHENNMLNVLSTKNYPIKREVKSEKNVENTSKDKNNFQVHDYANDDYNYNGSTNSYEQNDHYDALDTSFESLSNKISYNDYVNGFKYYLNSQKDPEDLRFSNVIRYQAHKHHKVDDIGKYILNKIPQLPTTRLKRKFVETETLDDQDVSTKSEDSWFKKHFFIFLDKDTPKKFHSAQTVTFKDFKAQHNKNTKNSKNFLTTDLYVVNNNITTPMTPLIPKKSNSDHGKRSQDLKTTLNSKNIGLVDIDSVQVTLVTENPRKYNNKIVNYMLPKFRKSYYEKKKGKRETDLRVPRFNIFKTFKGTRKVSAKQSTGRQHLFDYEILSDINKSERNNNNIKITQKDEYERNHDSKYENESPFRVDDIMKQIPNITIDFPTIYPIRTAKYNNFHVTTTRSEDYHNNMVNNEKLGIDYLTNNFLNLQDKRTLVFKDKINKYLENLEDDSINMNDKSALPLPNNYNKEYFATFSSISSMTREGIGKEIEDLKSRIKSFDADNGNKDATSINRQSDGRFRGNEVIIKAYPYKQSLLIAKSPKVVKYTRDYKQYLKDVKTLDSNDIDWLITNIKHELNKNKHISNVNKEHHPQKTTKNKNKSKTSNSKLSHKNKDLINATVTKTNKISDKHRVYNKKEKIKPNDKKSNLIFVPMHNDEPVSYTETIKTENFDDIYLLKFTKSIQPNEKVKPEDKVKNYFGKDYPSNAYKREQDDRNILMKKIPRYSADYTDETTVNPNGARLTHIFKENRLKFTLLKSLLTNSSQANSTTSMSVPKRVHMIGESYKYDIIFHGLNNRNQDLDYDSGIALSAYQNINNNELAVDGSLEDRQRGRKGNDNDKKRYTTKIICYFNSFKQSRRTNEKWSPQSWLK